MDSNDKQTLSRRHVVGGVGAGLAVAGAGSALAAETSNEGPTIQPMRDPATKYPRPPFNRQTQPWPGLAAKMDPQPDHGEKSYRGSGRLAGRKALVTGGDSGMGRAAALPHLKPGSTIIGTTSEQAYDPSPDLYDYAQTKAATMNYVKSLAKQLAPKGIRANGVAPGPIWTPLLVSGGASQQKLENFGGSTVFGRPGQPAELASIYVRLASEDASFATGQVYGSASGTGQP